MDAPVAPSSYIEQVSRAAVYDQPFTTSTTTEPASTVAEGTFVPEPPLPALAGLVEGATSALPTELE